jgi:hypothetical protein
MRIILTVLLLALSSLCGAQPAAPTNPTGGSAPLDLSVANLHVSGTRILNGLNQAVQLRGVNKDGAEYMCLSPSGTAVFDGPADATDTANLRTWGVNIVRLPVNEQCWLGINSLPSASYNNAFYQSEIVAEVNRLTAANIATVIDLQWAAPGVKQANQLAPMPDADHASAFWTSVANTFKTNRSVIFDLYNEPYPDSNQDTPAAWSCLLNGCTSVYPSDSSTYTSVGMQSLVNTVRATGSTNIIMSPCVQFANGCSQWLSNKPIDATGNLVTASHSYQGQSCSSQACYDSIYAPILALNPIILGEIGENDCQHTYVDAVMAWMDARYGHYIAWAWNTYDCSSFPAVISAYDGTPTAFGIGIRDHLLQLRGSTPPTPPVIPFFNNGSFPTGVAIGAASNYTAVDGTVYFADTLAQTGLAVQATNNPPFYSFSMSAYSTADTITGTVDPQLYQKGRTGCCAKWIINVPNGNYTVTLAMAPNSSFTAGTFGQDQILQGNTVGNCIWSSSPSSSGGCGVVQTNPALDVAATISYSVLVTNQQLSVQTNASNGGGQTTILSAIKVVQQGAATVPPTPTNLQGTPGNQQASLAWTSSSGATTYKVYRALAATSGNRAIYRQIAAATTNAYVDSSVTNNKTYSYVISAANSAGVSAKTSSINVTPSLPIPNPPSNVAAAPGNQQITISWTASTGATSYNVKRSLVTGGPYGTVGSPAASPYLDTGLTNGTPYFYVASALNSQGESSNSSQVTATPSAGGATGVWTNVTPSGPNLSNPNLCGTPGNFGTETIGHDAANQATMYAAFDSFGIYKSTDYGATWFGPVNTGALASTINSSCGAGLTVGSGGVIYYAAIRGTPGLFKSSNGGVDWAQITISPLPGNRQDVYPPQIDPYNASHLLMPGHEQNALLQSFDAGATWSSVTMTAGMQAYNGGTGFIFFVNTGNSGTTANTWLWIQQWTSNTVGTWRTTNGGSTWDPGQQQRAPAWYCTDVSAEHHRRCLHGRSRFVLRLRRRPQLELWAELGPSRHVTERKHRLGDVEEHLCLVRLGDWYGASGGCAVSDSSGTCSWSGWFVDQRDCTLWHLPGWRSRRCSE